jgi:hypothetical protein
VKGEATTTEMTWDCDLHEVSEGFHISEEWLKPWRIFPVIYGERKPFDGSLATD